MSHSLQQIQTALSSGDLPVSLVMASGDRFSVPSCPEPTALWSIDDAAIRTTVAALLGQALSALDPELVAHWSPPCEDDCDEEVVMTLYRIGDEEAVLVQGGVRGATMVATVAYYRFADAQSAATGIAQLRHQRNGSAFARILGSVEGDLKPFLREGVESPDMLVSWLSSALEGPAAVRFLYRLAEAAKDAARRAVEAYLKEHRGRIVRIMGYLTQEAYGDDPVLSIPWVYFTLDDGREISLLVLEDPLLALKLSGGPADLPDWVHQDGEREHALERVSRNLGIESWPQYWDVLYRCLIASTVSVDMSFVDEVVS